MDRMTFEEWFKREYPLFEREGRGTTLKHQLHAAWEAGQALDRDAVLDWLDNNTTFYDVEDSPREGPNIPVLALVSKRIWYHATDDRLSYPFSKVIEFALKREPSADPQGWVPVIARVPKVDITVLFYDVDGVVNKGARRRVNHDIAWIADDDVDGMPHLGVTHWMPLPPAP